MTTQFLSYRLGKFLLQGLRSSTDKHRKIKLQNVKEIIQTRLLVKCCYVIKSVKIKYNAFHDKLLTLNQVKSQNPISNNFRNRNTVVCSMTRDSATTAQYKNVPNSLIC